MVKGNVSQGTTVAGDLGYRGGSQPPELSDHGYAKYNYVSSVHETVVNIGTFEEGEET